MQGLNGEQIQKQLRMLSERNLMLTGITLEMELSMQLQYKEASEFPSIVNRVTV